MGKMKGLYDKAGDALGGLQDDLALLRQMCVIYPGIGCTFNATLAQHNAAPRTCSQNCFSEAWPPRESTSGCSLVI